MDFTTVERVKELNNLRTNEHDSLIRSMISSISLQIERYLSIQPLVTEYTEYFDIKSGSMHFFTEVFPIHSITEIINDYNRIFTNVLPLDTSTYTFEPDSMSSKFTIDRVTLIKGHRVLRVKYVGGFAFKSTYYTSRVDDPSTLTPTTGERFLIGSNPSGVWSGSTNKVATWDGTQWVIEDQDLHFRINHPDIVQATDLQISHVWQRRHRMGATQTNVRNNMVQYGNDVIIPMVASILDKRKRRVFSY